jgi:predicted transcriptional regulator
MIGLPMYLFNLQKRYWEEIYRGEKRYEFRKRVPKSSSPFVIFFKILETKQVEGFIIGGQPICGPITKMIQLKLEYSNQIESLREYFKNVTVGYAIPIIAYDRLLQPISQIALSRALKVRSFQGFRKLDTRFLALLSKKDYENLHNFVQNYAYQLSFNFMKISQASNLKPFNL